jgi:hypothetical protein
VAFVWGVSSSTAFLVVVMVAGRSHVMALPLALLVAVVAAVVVRYDWPAILWIKHRRRTNPPPRHRHRVRRRPARRHEPSHTPVSQTRHRTM